MSSAVSFWKKVGTVLRFDVSRGERSGSLPAAPIVLPGADRLNRDSADDFASRLDQLLPWRARKRREREELSERQSRVVELLGAMKAHFESQDLRAQQLNSAVERVADTLERIAAVQDEQRKNVAALASHAEVAGKNTAALLATTVELPAAMQSQAEAVRSVAKRLEHSRAIDLQLADTLNRFGGAVETLQQSGRSQIAAIERLNAADDRQQADLRGFIRDQNRRLYVVCGILAAAVLLAACAISAGPLLAFWR